MEKPLLNEPEIFPSDEVLKNVLDDSFVVYKEFMDTITNADYSLSPQWNYYKDGKSWLCKISYKKKTVLWFSVWDKFFKTSFFFTEKHLEGIAELDISEAIKTDFSLSKPVGKLIPLIISIDKKEQLDDLLKIITFKKSLK